MEFPSYTVDMTQQSFEEAAGYIHEVPLRSNLLDYCSRLEEPVGPGDRDEIARHSGLARAEFLEEPRNGQYFHDEEASRRQLEYIMRNAPAQTLRTAGN
ncbi:hypothetical protein [Arthrobacter sp. H14]|uniref:hypothetical protein n=1 Tax=Arthrobacter sp. H14 TaxID=1312959 RepID=UPI0012DF4F95|nr:hypothetical protein [Arthrobacter sp. H14]